MAEFHDLDWTLPTMRYLLDLRLDHAREQRESDIRFNDERDRRYTEVGLEREKAIVAAFQASEKAIAKAEANAEKWRESANEWRGAMSDRDRELPSRREVEAMETGLAQRLDTVEKHMERTSGKSESAEKADLKSMNLTIAAVGFVIAVVSVAANLLTGS